MLFSIFTGQIYILGRNLNHGDDYGTVYLVLVVIRHSHFCGQFFQTELIQFLFICIAIFSELCVHFCVMSWSHGEMLHSYGIALQRMRKILLAAICAALECFFTECSPSSRAETNLSSNATCYNYHKVSSPKLDCSDLIDLCVIYLRVSAHTVHEHQLVPPCNLGQKT